MKVKLSDLVWCYLFIFLINHNWNGYSAAAKSLDITSLTCQDHVGEFFKSFLNISIVPSEKPGEPQNIKCLRFSFFKAYLHTPPCYIFFSLSAIRFTFFS